MKRAEQYENLIKLKRVINERLQDLDFAKIKELILWLTKSIEFQKIKSKDNQFSMLDTFMNLWIEEKKQLEPMGIQEDIFTGITSLEDVESKYLAVKYCALRLENDVPEEFCEQGLENIVELKISGITLARIITFETLDRQGNMIKMARRLKDRGQLLTAIHLLQNGLKSFPKEKDMLLELTDCWIMGQQWRPAYECLKEIESPDQEIQELMSELEKVM